MTMYGNAVWQEFERVIRCGRGDVGGRLPRGGTAVGATSNGVSSQLPVSWEPDVRHASHVIYHHGTPIAWIDGRDGGWVVPDVHYSVTTSGCQNRIREALTEYRTEPRP